MLKKKIDVNMYTIKVYKENPKGIKENKPRKSEFNIAKTSHWLIYSMFFSSILTHDVSLHDFILNLKCNNITLYAYCPMKFTPLKIFLLKSKITEYL